MDRLSTFPSVVCRPVVTLKMESDERITYVVAVRSASCWEGRRPAGVIHEQVVLLET